MERSREAVLALVTELLRTLASDAGEDVDVTEDTLILGGMNWQSIEIVVLANEMQQRYEQTFPFAEFFAEVGKRESHDISVREWADFVYANLSRESDAGRAETRAS